MPNDLQNQTFEDYYKEIYENYTYQMTMYEARKFRFFIDYLLYSGFLNIPEAYKEEFAERLEAFRDSPFKRLAETVSIFDHSVPSMAYEEENKES